MAEDAPVAIVTGGAQGLGAAICSILLKQGYKVCVADIQEAKGKDFVKLLQQRSGAKNVIYSYCDVSKEADFKSTFERTLENFKKVDLLVNNAGINFYDAKTLLHVNLLGTVYGCQTAMHYLGKSNGGNGGMVINIASVAGLLPIPEMPVYAASKHGVVGLTRSYGEPFTFRKYGIVFAALCPALINTEMLERTLEMNIFEETPESRNVLSPEYVAKGLLKLLEDKINGSTLLVTPHGYDYVEYPKELTLKLCL